MTLIKSTLLASATALVAIAGAQAADLPTKKAAPAAAYVAICNVAGVTGFTIPGSDTCLKISGGVGVEMIYAQRKNISAELPGGAAQATFANNANRFGMDGRAWLTLDTATNTAYGPATSEAQFNFGADNAGMPTNYGNGASLDHAWFKWAGLEGHVADGSLFNIGPNPQPTDSFGAGDIGGAAYLAYVAQFGGGFMAGISIEDPIGHRAAGVNGAVINPNVYAGSTVPDVAAKIGVSQGWGSAYVSGIWHQTKTIFPATATTNGYGLAGAVSVKAGPMATFNLSGEYSYGMAKIFSQAVGTSNLYAGGADYVVTDVWYNAGGVAVVPKVWGISADVAITINPQISITPYASYGQLTYSADPINIPKTLKGWNVGTDFTWTPVSAIAVDLNVLYTSLTESVPTAVPAGGAWNTKANGFLGRLQIKRTF